MALKEFKNVSVGYIPDTEIELNNKTIFVTGAAGFIGSNLVKRLFKDVKGATIIGIDNMNDYYDVVLKEYITNPDAYIMSNMIGFYNILEACRHRPVEHLVYASSSSVYGLAGRPDMAYFGFTNKLLKGETIQIFNYGNCRRDFTYVDDIVEGVYRVMQLSYWSPF